jgi:hypothetical protein
MASDPNPLDQLLRLKPSSSGFDDKVSNVLQGQAYRTWVKGIGGDDVVELAEFLDRVRRGASFFASRSSPRRLLMFLTLLAPVSGDVCDSSGTHAVQE